MLELFGEKLHWLRAQRGMTQIELAQRLELGTQSHVSHLETGRSAPSLDLAVRAANLFGVTTDYLLRDMIPIDHPTFYHAASQVSGDFAQRFGMHLRQLRKQRGLTQVELASQLGGLSQAAVSAFERGEKASSIEILLQCADVFGVTTDDLLRHHGS